MLGKTCSSEPPSQHSCLLWFEDFVFILEFCFEQQESMKAKKNYPIRKCLGCFLPCPRHIYSGAKPINWKSYLSVLLFQTCPFPSDLGPILLEFLRLNFLHVWSQESLSITFLIATQLLCFPASQNNEFPYLSFYLIHTLPRHNFILSFISIWKDLPNFNLFHTSIQKDCGWGYYRPWSVAHFGHASSFLFSALS